MRVLIALTYYSPYLSGLTLYASRLARALVRRGHSVTVLASRHDAGLPLEEVMDGVRVVRAPVALRISKGVLMPAFSFKALALAREADLVNLHLPQLDAAPVALLSQRLKKPILATYHCDLTLPPGGINRVANAVSNLANRITLSTADRVVTNTQDYAEHSAYLRPILAKVRVIPPPVELPEVSDADRRDFLARFPQAGQGRVIGMVGRLAAEKGAEYLVEALPAVLERFPDARVLHAGNYQNVLGEEAYARRLAPQVAALGERWRFLGPISDHDLAVLLRLIDVFVLPSINPTESFGAVQIEAMSSGAPVVATDLPGVRQPVRLTGMGKVVPPCDSAALASGLVEILSDPARYRRNAPDAVRRFHVDTIAAEYEQTMQELLPLP
jgi:glycosyltransferase involved in cell wall biosynthesis